MLPCFSFFCILATSFGLSDNLLAKSDDFALLYPTSFASTLATSSVLLDTFALTSSTLKDLGVLTVTPEALFDTSSTAALYVAPVCPSLSIIALILFHC